MAYANNFIVKNGLSINQIPVINSSGNWTGPAIPSILVPVSGADATQNNQIQAAFNQANVTVGIDNTQNNQIQAAFNQANLDFTTISTTPGIYGNSSSIPIVTVSSNGRISSVGSAAINIPSLNDTVISNTLMVLPRFSSYSEIANNLGPISGNYNLDLSNTNIFICTLTGNTTITFINPPSVNISKPVTLIIKQDGVGGRTLTATGAKYTDGVVPVLTTTPNRTDVLTFFTIDGGASYFGSFVMANIT